MALKWKQDEQRETNKNLRLKNILKSGQPKFLINSTDNMEPYSLVELKDCNSETKPIWAKDSELCFLLLSFPPFRACKPFIREHVDYRDYKIRKLQRKYISKTWNCIETKKLCILIFPVKYCSLCSSKRKPITLLQATLVLQQV